MADRVGLGIVGFGWAGQQHAEAAKALGDRTNVVAVADPDPAIRELAERTWRVPAVHRLWEQLLADDSVDVVSVCSPHSEHAAAVIAALESGRPVLVEKPLASSLAEADRMIEAAERSGKPLMVAESVRFRSVFRDAKRLITSGEIGRPFMVAITRIHHMHEYLRARSWFLNDPAGGIMASGGIHDFEIVRMLGGEMASVFARQAPRTLAEMAADDTSVAVATLESGAIATVTESFSTIGPEPSVRGVVYGSSGTLWFDQDGGLTLMRAGSGKAEEIGSEPNDPFVDELSHFLDCVQDGRKPDTDAREQRRPLAAVAAAYASMRLGRPVTVGEVEHMEGGRLGL